MVNDAGGQTPPPGVDDGNRGIGVDDNGNTIGGADRQRQVRPFGEEGIGLAGRAGTIDRQHHSAVDLMHPGPLVGDAELASGSCPRLRLGEVAVADRAKGSPGIGGRRDQRSIP